MQTKPLATNFPIRNRYISGFSLGTIVTEATRNSGALITAQHAIEQGKTVFAVPGPIGSPNTDGTHWLIRQGAILAEKISDIIEEIPQYAREIIKEEVVSEGNTSHFNKVDTVTPEIQLPLSISIQTSNDTITAKSEPKNMEKVHQQAVSCVGSSQSLLEQKILSILSPEGSYVDEVALSCQISVSEALSTLTLMEIKGWVKQFSGKRFAKV